jgi:sulfur-carrier protein
LLESPIHAHDHLAAGREKAGRGTLAGDRAVPISGGMRILYFAWLRSRIGIAEEEIEPPRGVATVGGLLSWLKERGPRFAEALKDEAVIRVAVNHDYVGWDHPLAPGDEVALFPPVTGG